MANNWPDALFLARKIVIWCTAEDAGDASDRRYKYFAHYVPYASPNQPFSGDLDDYSSGLGVFMRYLYYSYTRSTEIKGVVDNPDYRLAIANAADAACDNTIPPSAVNIFTGFNRLATLMMGILQNS